MGKSRNPIRKKINFFFAIISLNLKEISDRMTNQAPANTTSAAGREKQVEAKPSGPDPPPPSREMLPGQGLGANRWGKGEKH